MSKKAAVEEEARLFMGRTVRKEIFNLGTAGVIERTSVDPSTPPEATVTFQAKATVNAIKHRFLENGGVEESTILAIDAGSFEILSVEEKVEDPRLPLDGEDGEGESE